MQAVKEKLEDMKEMRKVKAEAKAEEKAEKELAKARIDVAHEVRVAKEAKASMEMHMAKAGRKVERELEKHGAGQPLQSNMVGDTNLNEANNFANNPNNVVMGDTTSSTTANFSGAPPPTNKYT